MKITATTLLVVALILVSLFCIHLLSRQDAYSRDIQDWKVKYNVARSNAEMIEVASRARIEKINAVIAKRDEYIAVAQETILSHKTELGKKDLELFNLEAKNQGDIEVVRAQLQIWKEKFSIASSMLDGKDIIILNLTKKIEEKDKIILEYKGMYENQVRLTRLGEIGFDIAERRYKKRNNITWIAIYVLGGIVIYQTLKGDG